MNYEPIKLLEHDATYMRNCALLVFADRPQVSGISKSRDNARAQITYAKFLRDLLKGTFLSGDDASPTPKNRIREIYASSTHALRHQPHDDLKSTV